MKIYHGMIYKKDGSRGSFSMSIRGLSKMLQNEDFSQVVINGKREK